MSVLSDFLGRTEIRVADIKKDQGSKGPVTKCLLLHEVPTGEIVVRLDLQLFDEPEGAHPGRAWQNSSPRQQMLPVWKQHGFSRTSVWCSATGQQGREDRPLQVSGTTSRQSSPLNHFPC